MGGKKMGDNDRIDWKDIILIVLECVTIFFIGMFFLTGCKTYKDTENKSVTRIDTMYQKVLVRDSIYVQDSILIREKGDTIFSEKWHTKYVDRWRTDTLYKTKIDTAYIRIEKNSSLSKSERATIFCVDFVVSFALLIIALIVRWFKRKSKTGK